MWKTFYVLCGWIQLLRLNNSLLSPKIVDIPIATKLLLPSRIISWYNLHHPFSSTWVVTRCCWSHFHGRRKFCSRIGHLRHRSFRCQGWYRSQRGRWKRRLQHHSCGRCLLPLCYSSYSTKLVLCVQVNCGLKKSLFNRGWAVLETLD